ncbi:MAG: DUF4340 domain-containing protein [Tahibacter sp.]
MNHLNHKTVVRLGVAAVAAILAAVALNAGRKPITEESAQATVYALPELHDHLNDVSAVTLTGAGEKLLVSLQRTDAGWHVKNKGGFPADAAKIGEFLFKLHDASILEPKTSVESRYAELAVNDVKAADAKGVLVALDGLPKPAQLIIGNPNSRNSGTYVRRAGEMPSWLVKGALAPEKSAANWLAKALVDLPATRIRELMLTRPDGKVLRAYKNKADDANFAVADVPKGRELSSDFAANGLASTVAGMNLDDVFPAGEAAPSADAKVYKAQFHTFDGISLAILAWKRDDKALARISASLDQAQAEASIDQAQLRAKTEWDTAQKAIADQAEKAKAADAKPIDSVAPLSVTDPAKDKAQRLESLKTEAESLSKRFDGWTFVLPEHKFSNIDKSIEDLLKPLDSGKAAGKPADAKAAEAKKPMDIKSAKQAMH